MALPGMLLLAMAYFAAARLGLSLAVTAEQVTAVWPPTGIALGVLLLFGGWLWPGIALGAFLANLFAHEPWHAALVIAAGNTLEGLVGMALVRRVAGPGGPLARVRGLLAFIGLGALVAPVIAATVGMLALCLSGVQRWDSFVSLWGLWWLGDAAGALVVAPVILAWGGASWPRLPAQRAAEAVVLLLGLAALSTLVFSGASGAGQVGPVLAYALFPFVIWAALRFGRRGTTAVTLLASGLAICGTVLGTGPFVLGGTHVSLMLLQMFMALVAVTGLVLAALDHQRDRVETELRESELRYSSLAEAVPGILFTNRSDGACDYVSQAFLDYTGMTLHDSLGWGWSTAVHLGDLERTRTRWQAAVAESRMYEAEFRMRASDGTYAWFTSRSVPARDATGRIVKWFGVCVNIDRQKKDEAALHEADRRKDEFLAVLGHELRNPLAPILHAAEVLGGDGAEGRPAEQARELIARQVGHMVRLVDDLLDVARVTQGRIRLRPQPCDLADIVRETCEDFRPVLAANDITLVLRPPPGPLWMTGDPTRLAQAVSNVLHNAGKFTEPGGRVTVELGADASGRRAILSITDTGIGMDEQTLAALFEAFSQADRSAAHTRGGLGLGLTLVKGLVALHGGETRAHSAGPGQGSRLEIVLPIDREPPLVLPEPPLPAAHPRRVLVIEDSTDAAQALRILLERSGHTVEVAHDGLGGVAAALRSRPDVVLCDIGLPGLDGYGVAKRLRETPALAGTFLVAITGYGKDEDRHRARAAGFDVHLTKPVTFRDLQGLLCSGHAAR
ncbi:MAG TPA: MASE1 domain-containing protein [Planctomycetota bacterium]|nr:MASE1 domain-containing protein [Planctomycetota bacterium]